MAEQLAGWMVALLAVRLAVMRVDWRVARKVASLEYKWAEKTVA
jgi:hypothetical protein